jgi:4-hydroxybenzoate polyprenyltransferase
LAVTTISTSTPLQPLRIIAADIKLAHSVFALPFAILAVVMAGEQAIIIPDDDRAFWPGLYLLGRLLGPLTLVVLAMFFARTVAMLANRYLDREIDVRNPRTAGRAIPSGRLSPRQVIAAIASCASAFMLVCAGFGLLYDNWWPLILGLPVLAWISAYGYFKRFTALCHLYLGSSLAISPIAAAIAIHPQAISPFSAEFQPALWLLSGMVLCWVAGFDIIYALQDIDVDRSQGLHSIPARLGVSGALWASRLLHLVAAVCLLAALRFDERFGMVFGLGVTVVITLLIFEHLTVARWGTTKIALAFFTLNGFISCVLGALGVADILL